MTSVSNITDSIIRHSPENLILGLEIYTAIAEWEKREIPEKLALSAVEEFYIDGSTNMHSSLPRMRSKGL